MIVSRGWILVKEEERSRCPERGQSVLARRVNLPNIMEIYSRGIQPRNGFSHARSRALVPAPGAQAPRRPLLSDSLATLAPPFRSFAADEGPGERFKLSNVAGRCARCLKR